MRAGGLVFKKTNNTYMKKIIVPTVCLAAIFLGACSKKEEQKQAMPATPAQLVQAVSKSVPAYISTLGTTASTHSVSVVPQVSGQIVEIKFNQGDMVKKGQVLAVIDKRPFEAAVKQAEGSLAQAQAQLKIDELQVKRNEKLAKDNYIDQMSYDTLVAKVEIDKGVIEAAQAALETAKINLGWCDITAPADGKAGLYNINAGNVVAAGSSVITTIEQVDDLYVDFVIPSQRLFDVQNLMKDRGGKLKIIVTYIEGDLAERSREATVDIILNKIRYETGTAVLRGKIENKDHMFWPDQPVKVVLDMEDVKDAVLVPNICVQNNNIGPYVYVATPYRDGVYTIKQLQVGKGQLYGDAMRMVTGLKPGEFVAERVSQLRLQFGPFVYRTNMQGVPYGADGKLITNPQEIQKFIMSTEPIVNELRAKMMQAQAGQEKKAEAARQENAAVEEKEVIQSQDAK